MGREGWVGRDESNLVRRERWNCMGRAGWDGMDGMGR